MTYTEEEKQLVRDIASIEEPLWMPREYTKPLSEDFPTDGDRLIRFADEMYVFEDSDEYKLYEWQRWLIRHVLEKYPEDHPDPYKAGNLRYRECLVMVARQNGKSEVGAIFALYGYLLQKRRGANVLILAHDTDAARISFGKIKYAVENNPVLNKRFKTTHHKGIYSRDRTNATVLKVKSGNGKGLQGHGVNFCLFDEVHISRQDAWSAMVVGMTAEPNAMLLGITTAGDENSTLLKDLLERGKKAINQEEGYDERLGCFLWYSPEHLDLYDPAGLIMANPTLAEGHRSLEMDLNTLRSLPEHEALRFKLNRFVSSQNVWMPLDKWLRCAGEAPFRKGDPVVFAVDRAYHSWEAVSISAGWKVGDTVYTYKVAQIMQANVDKVATVCMALYNHYNPQGFYMDSAVLKDLVNHLRAEGVPVEYLTSTQMSDATATTYSLVSQGRLVHNNDEVVRRQLPKTMTENAGEGYKVSRKKSEGYVDAVVSTIIAAWAAENMKPIDFNFHHIRP